ncbi:hypothetical protein VTK56DRAFT_8636 [Thermocarpiscus australiensis]
MSTSYLSFRRYLKLDARRHASCGAMDACCRPLEENFFFGLFFFLFECLFRRPHQGCFRRPPPNEAPWRILELSLKMSGDG